MIPLLYTDYARTGDARQMPDIFYHNREDILSMVSIADQLCVAFSIAFDGAFRRRENDELHDGDLHSGELHSCDLHGHEWLSLGQCCEVAEEGLLAERAYRLALDLLTGSGDGVMEHRADAFRLLGALQKRQARWSEATETWQLWLSSITETDPTPYIELAKYCEWQIHDLEQAEMWAAWALHNQTTSNIRQRPSRLVDELEHRLARIRKKRKPR